MKNIFGVVTALVVGLGLGGGSVWFLTRIDSSPQSAGGKESVLTGLMHGSDRYEIKWTGNTGAKLLGGIYVIAYPYQSKKPPRIEKVEASLPHDLKFSEMKGAIITAGGSTYKQGDVDIEIFRNGKSCGEIIATGSAGGNGKICNP